LKTIKHVLTERYYLWQDAVELAKNDSEVDLSGRGPAFTPQEDAASDDQYFEKYESVQSETPEKIDPSIIPSDNSVQPSPKA
jgi:large subunit ribosomal protein L47